MTGQRVSDELLAKLYDDASYYGDSVWTQRGLAQRLAADLRAAREEVQRLRAEYKKAFEFFLTPQDPPTGEVAPDLPEHLAAMLDQATRDENRQLQQRIEAALAALAKISDLPLNRVHLAFSILGGGSSD